MKLLRQAHPAPAFHADRQYMPGGRDGLSREKPWLVLGTAVATIGCETFLPTDRLCLSSGQMCAQNAPDNRS
jgi:hypothetical protein